MTELTASVIVRCKNKEDTIGLTLASLRRQTVQAEIVVVDSGSTDGTIDVARQDCDVLIEIPARDFTYGRSLNIGAARASGEILFALSAHSAPTTSRWIEWSLEAYSDPLVAATAGLLESPDRESLGTSTSFGDRDLCLTTNPFWGMSNHASSWRRSTWRSFPFNEEIIACEDKEWMWRVLRNGLFLVADPRLYIDTKHRRAEGLRRLYRREYRERLALAEMLAYDPMSFHRALDAWWSEFPFSSDRPLWQRRLSPWRTTELLGSYLGDRAGARRRGRSPSRPS